MDAREVETFRKLLNETITELNESIKYLKEASKPIEPSCALGRLTRMEAIGEKGVNEAVLSKSKARLIRLKNALNRIDAGTYGVCVKCKTDIPLGRLKAVPEALICVNCANSQ